MSLQSRVRGRIADLIGGTKQLFRFRVLTGSTYLNTADYSNADYSYWDKVRRAQVKGLELAGLLLKPLGSKIAAWVMGQVVDWRLQNDYTQGKLQQWWRRHHASILRGYEESIHLGDCYLVVNADLSVTILPPNVVTPLYAETDFSQLVGWRIEENYPDFSIPSSRMTIVDEYIGKWRTRTFLKDGTVVSGPTRYRNPIGMLPVVHVANLFGSDEIFGRPEGHALPPVLQRYGDILETALKGNIRQGRPTPVIEKMGTAEQVRKFWEKFGRRETQTLPDGTVESVDVIDFDPDQLLTLGGESQFNYKSPGSFGADAQILLQILYYLIIEHTEVPEFVWGGAIGASKASADSQLEPFLKWLEKKRGYAESWMVALARVVLAYMEILDTKIKVEEPTFEWRSITSENGQIAVNAITWAYAAGIMDEETALTHLPLHIADPRAVLKKARAEYDLRVVKNAPNSAPNSPAQSQTNPPGQDVPPAQAQTPPTDGKAAA